MQKNTAQWIWGLSTCAAAFLVSLILYPPMFCTFEFNVVSVPVILNAIAFLVGYSILKPLKTLVFWKFTVYIVIITGVNWFTFSMRGWDWSLPLVGGNYSWFFCFVLPFAVSILLNIGFLKYLFGIETRMAILMGILIGFTNAQSIIVSLPILCHNRLDSLSLLL